MISGGEALAGIRKNFRGVFRSSHALFFLTCMGILVSACTREDVASGPRQSIAHDRVLAFLDFVAEHPGLIQTKEGRSVDPELYQTLRKLGRDQKEAAERAREVYRARDFPYVFSEILP
jgi:hypothetical protein